MKKILFFFFLAFFLLPQEVFAGDIVINEFLARPSSGSDWLELYNTTNQSIVLDNWTLVDSTSTMKTLSGSIDPNGFVIFEVSTRLNNGGDTITLNDNANAILDTYNYSQDPGIDISIGRNPDGTGSFALLSSITKGSPNSSQSPTATFTPTPTSIPSNTPIPTKTPTPTKTLTPTSTSKATATSKPTPTLTPAPTLTKQPGFSPSPTFAETIQPSSVLGESTVFSLTPSPTSSVFTPTPVVKVAGQSFTTISKVAIALGVVFVAASGILAFRSYKRAKNDAIGFD